MTNVNETSAINQVKWQNTCWDFAMTRSHYWMLRSMLKDCKQVTRIICGECGEGLVCGVHFQQPISLVANASMSAYFFICRLFDWMLGEIVAGIYRCTMSDYSRCLINVWNGSCARLCLIDVEIDWIIKNILEINRPGQKTVNTIKI
jgi:hypothetical protein